MTAEETLLFLKLFRKKWDECSKTKNAEALDSAIKIVENSIQSNTWKVTVELAADKKDYPTEFEFEEGVRFGLNEVYNNWNISSIVYDDIKY